MSEQERYEKYIETMKQITKSNRDKSDWNKMSTIKKIQNVAKSMSIIGCINLLIYVLFTFLVQLYMSKSTHIFKGFKWYHHFMWIAIIFIQVIYVIYLVYDPSAVSSLMEGAIYDIFTVDIIENNKFKWNKLFGVVKNLLKAILVEPLMEYVLLIVLMAIPWPFLKTVSYSHRLHIIFMKVGIFNILISLICMNYNNMQVETILKPVEDRYDIDKPDKDKLPEPPTVSPTEIEEQDEEDEGDEDDEAFQQFARNYHQQ
jgi:hypothetical protein